jgi:hypothetical protein
VEAAAEKKQRNAAVKEWNAANNVVVLSDDDDDVDGDDSDDDVDGNASDDDSSGRGRKRKRAHMSHVALPSQVRSITCTSAFFCCLFVSIRWYVDSRNHYLPCFCFQTLTRYVFLPSHLTLPGRN